MKEIKRERDNAKKIARDLRYNRQYPNYARDIDSCETAEEITVLMRYMRRHLKR